MNIQTFLKQFHSRQIPSQQVAILCHLADYHSDLETISRETGMSVPTLSNHLSRMVKMELISRANVGQRRTYSSTEKGRQELESILRPGGVK